MIRAKRRRNVDDEEENLLTKKVKTFHPGPWRKTTLIKFPTRADQKRDITRKKNLKKSEYNSKYQNVLKSSDEDELCDLLENTKLAPATTSAVDTKLRDVLDSILSTSRN